MQDIRKVQVTNKETLIISLPKRWYPDFPVQGGDDVILSLQPDGSVLLRRLERGRPSSRHADVAGRGVEATIALAESHYAAGDDGLVLTGVDPAARHTLKERLAGLFGCAVVDETESALEVRFLAAGRSAPLPQALRRLCALAVAALQGEPGLQAEAARIHLLVLRLVNRMLDAKDTSLAPAVARRQALAALQFAEALRLLVEAALDGPAAPRLAGLLEEALAARGSADAQTALQVTEAFAHQAGSHACTSRLAAAVLRHLANGALPA